ncbi:transcriptional regulator [Kurthia zopfii]|uniref:HTH-type transcriptional regulator PuuR n=1 Tax=Kurthia zopfii TaxID=1650 RepID=A0A2U3ABR4_9BACL|nr:XRE family transcriptional regulator [Kurthia zopfii]PWI21986.1 Cro/Cl family transcriptional regulator [Kurthia zopfii]TDR33200.1 XRE family transcriptional regulator [Kurthia zopfii]STX08936.1 HTH-type transcriptional regulator PuuR [Kurthia zopfii]VEI04852.1 HTH-type transcriptional regulator PuuR [Kurthia zopfii]GEK32190.1 transcriptional regulator [Kurthia zopfii]
MQIGKKIKRLRLRKELTQEELGERTDLTKGYISQLERDLNSPSIETLFNLLEVLGSTPKEFFDDDIDDQKVVYTPEDQTIYTDEEKRYKIQWLIPTSNEKEIEPVVLTFEEHGEFKQFEPSPSETFIYVLEGCIRIQLGKDEFTATAGNAAYFEATDSHQIFNTFAGRTQLLLVATESYL